MVPCPGPTPLPPPGGTSSSVVVPWVGVYVPETMCRDAFNQIKFWLNRWDKLLCFYTKFKAQNVWFEIFFGAGERSLIQMNMCMPNPWSVKIAKRLRNRKWYLWLVKIHDCLFKMI